MRGIDLFFKEFSGRLMIEKSDKSVIEFHSNDSIDERGAKILCLLDDNNLSSRCLQLLSLACNVNIIGLSYDTKSSNPFVLQEYQVPDKTFVFEGCY